MSMTWETPPWVKIHENCGGLVRWREAIEIPGVGFTGECDRCTQDRIPTEQIIPLYDDFPPESDEPDGIGSGRMAPGNIKTRIRSAGCRIRALVSRLYYRSLWSGRFLQAARPGVARIFGEKLQGPVHSRWRAPSDFFAIPRKNGGDAA